MARSSHLLTSSGGKTVLPRKLLARRLAKLEDAADRWLDRSGSLAARQAQRERLIELSKIPEAVDLAREYAELMVAGLPTETVEEKLNDLWRLSCG